MSESDPKRPERVVECRLFVDGKVIHFSLPGPLVAWPAKCPKGKGGKRG